MKGVDLLGLRPPVYAYKPYEIRLLGNTVDNCRRNADAEIYGYKQGPSRQNTISVDKNEGASLAGFFGPGGIPLSTLSTFLFFSYSYIAFNRRRFTSAFCLRCLRFKATPTMTKDDRARVRALAGGLARARAWTPRILELLADLRQRHKIALEALRGTVA